MQRKPESKHTHPHRTPQPGVAGYKGGTHTNTHTPTLQPGVVGRSRNRSPSTDTHAAHPGQEWRGTGRAGTQTHTSTARTPAWSGGVQAERPHQHTHSPTPQPGVAGRSQNPRPNTTTHTAHPSQEWRGASGARTRAHTQPNTPARSGGVQPKPEPNHTHPNRAPQPGVAGCKRSAHTSTHTAQQPSQEWQGAAETRAQAHTPKPHTPARRGGVQEEHAHQHTHNRTPQPGLAGRSGIPSPNTHTHTAQPGQEWRGTGGERTRAYTHPNTPARSGGAQTKAELQHTHPQRATQPGLAGCKRSAHTSTHGAQHPSKEWRGAAETGAQTHTPTARTSARSSRVQADRPHQHTHTPTPQPRVAGCSRNPSQNTHTHGAHPSLEWRGASGAPTPAHTPPNTPGRSGAAQPKPEPKHTHPGCAPQPRVAWRKRGAHTSTHTAQLPSQEWRGAAETRAQTHTATARTPARSGGLQAERPHQHTHSQEWLRVAETGAQAHTPMARTPARSGGVQAERPHQHTHSPTAQPGVAGCSRNPSPDTHTRSAHPSQEWQGASGAPTPAHTQPNTQARSGGV